MTSAGLAPDTISHAEPTDVSLIPMGPVRDGSPVVQRPVHSLFDDHVRQRPDATSVSSADIRLTYCQLSQWADHLSRVLRDLGVVAGDVVAVAVPRSVASVAALLGVLKSGATYLPLDPSYPPRRLEFILEDANPAAVVTFRSLMELFPQDRPCVVVDEPLIAHVVAGTAVRTPAATDRTIDVTPLGTAYIMYTSGSTGTPKGVAISHGALAAFFDAIDQEIPLFPTDKHLAVTSSTFDISMLELLYPICRGAEVVVAEKTEISDPAALAALIRTGRIRSLQATPSYLSLLVSHKECSLNDVRVLVGGEPLPTRLARELLTSAAEVWNLYGPTEATIWCTSHKLRETDVTSDAPGVVTIGQPLSNYRTYVLDGSLQPVPPGETGELYVAGMALAIGYLKRPLLTAQHFIPDIYGVGARMYRTGDLVRQRPDGRLEFLGRTDHQVKIHGVRVELGEIECALRSLQGVSDAVVVTRDGDAGQRFLVGYVASDVEGGASGNDFRRDLGHLLPEAMIPNTVVVLKALPLTSHGKIDRSALPQPERVSNSIAEAPATSTAEAATTRLLKLSAEVLGVEPVQSSDSFFDLGGDSIMGMRLVNLIRAEFGIDVPLRLLFDIENLGELGKELSL